MMFRNWRRYGAATLTVAALTLAGCSDGSTTEEGEGDDEGSVEDVSITLSNGFVNGWRLSLINEFQEAAQELQDQGVISDFNAVNTPGENSATEQASQIRSMILQDPDILMVIPASSTALVPVVEEACEADITVVVLDADMDAPCATIVRNDYAMWGEASLQPAIDAIDGEGTVVLNRGVIGSQPEEEFHARQQEILDEYPDIDVDTVINGFCDVSTAQQEITGVLGSLPEIDAVPGCVAGMGIAQAFESAGREVPVVVFDTDGKSLEYWSNEGIDNGSFSTLTDPGQGVAAMHVALAKLEGREVPDEILLPIMQISEDDRDFWVENLSADEYAAYPWDKESVDAAIDATIAGETVEAPAIQ